jgi:hypothetical protein
MLWGPTITVFVPFVGVVRGARLIGRGRIASGVVSLLVGAVCCAAWALVIYTVVNAALTVRG